MKLKAINESNPIKKRLLKGWKSNPENPIQGVMDEFDCDLQGALYYMRVFGAGTYGENDIDNRYMQRLRAPQSILKLLRHFEVSPTVISKLLNLYKEHKPSNNDDIHRASQAADGNVARGSANEESYKQLQQGKRLVSLIGIPDDKIEEIEAEGYDTLLVPWVLNNNDEYTFKYGIDNNYKLESGIYYVYRPEDQDVAASVYEQASLNTGQETILGALLNGLAFGYKMSDVFNYIRNMDSDLVDKVCGNIDEWEQWSNPSKA